MLRRKVMNSKGYSNLQYLYKAQNQCTTQLKSSVHTSLRRHEFATCRLNTKKYRATRFGWILEHTIFIPKLSAFSKPFSIDLTKLSFHVRKLWKNTNFKDIDKSMSLPNSVSLHKSICWEQIFHISWKSTGAFLWSKLNPPAEIPIVL